MKSIRFAAAATIALALAACGDTPDASEDAMADSVEMPADEAMADAPMPVQSAAIENAADQARDAAKSMEEVQEDAQQAAEEAQSAVDDIEAIESAVANAEGTME